MNVSCQHKIESIVNEVVATYLQENLKVQGLNKSRVSLDGGEDDEDDDDENFQKSEKTQKNENLDFFAKLMKAKVEDSCKLIINLFSQLSQQYQVNTWFK